MATEADPSSAGNKQRPDSQDMITYGKNYYYPFPSSKSASPVWKAFWLRRDIDYAETNKVFCMKCQSKSADGNTILHFEKWKHVTTTEPMQRHMRKQHPELLVEAAPSASKPVLQPLFSAVQKWNASKCLQFTKKMTMILLSRTKNRLLLWTE